MESNASQEHERTAFGLSQGYGEPMTEPRKEDQPVTLAPLDPEEALRALLAVKPNDEPVAAGDGDEPAAATSGEPSASD